MSTGNKTKKARPFFIRLAARGAAVLLFLALSAIIALHLPSVQKEIILGAVTRIEALTNFHMQIRSYLWLPFSSIYLTDVKIQSEGKQILDCGKVRLNYKLSIKPPYIVVKKLYLEKPFLLLERSPDGRWLFAPLSLKRGAKKADDEQADPVSTYIRLPGVQIVSGVVEAIQQGNTVLSIKDISCAAHLNAVTGPEGPEIQVDFEDLHARGQISGCGTWDIDGSGLVDGRRLQVRRMFFPGPNNCRIQVQGQWDIKNLENGQANLIVNNFSADAIPLLQPNLSGLSVASGSVAVAPSEGRWTFQHAQFTARLDPFVPGVETVQLCDLDGVFQNGILRIGSSTVKSSLADLKFTLTADLRGLWDLTHKGWVNAEVSIEKGNLEKISSALRQRLEGLVSIEANYDPGNFTSLRLWQARVAARLNVPETVSVEGSGTYSNRQVKAEYDLDLMDSQKISLLFPQWQGKGRVASRGTLKGTWPDLLWGGEINCARFQYSNCQADRLIITGKGKLAGKEERREISMKAQNVVFNGKRFASINFDLDQQNSSCSFLFKGEGILDQAAARLSGKLDRIWDFPFVSVSTQGQVDWNKLNVTADAKFDIQKEVVALQGTAKAAALSNPMMISARIPARFSFEPLQFEAKLADEFHSGVKICGLNADGLLPYLGFPTEAGGQLEGDIHCGISLKQPVVSGAGTWKNGSFQPKPWPHAAENIQAQWGEVDSKNLYVTEAEVSHLGGTVSVAGQIDYPHFRILNFKADGKVLHVQNFYGIEGEVSSHAEIRDNHEQAELTGTLLFSKAQMSLGKLETNIAQNIQVIGPHAGRDVIELRGPDKPGRFRNRLTMDVMLELPPDGTWITGKGLKAEINGSLKLKKNPVGPVFLAGELQALRGACNFQGKELKIVEGSPVFPGAPHVDPQLHMVCRKDVRDVTVQALVSGPVGHPKVVLSSIPVMNQGDILSYFMFERPAADLSASRSSQLQAGAASWLGSESSNIIKSFLGNNVLAPDTLGYRSYTGKYDHRFSYDQSQADIGKETGIVEIGKDITPDLRLIYGREVKGTEANEIQLEYRVNKALSLRTQVGAEQTGVDIFWRRDFGK